MEAGLVVVVNGASSSGKTSLARALQLLAPDPWLHAGIDRFWGMMPQGWMQLGARAEEGVSWLRGEDEYGRPVVHTVPGPVATRMARGMHRAVAALWPAGRFVSESAAALESIAWHTIRGRLQRAGVESAGHAIRAVGAAIDQRL